MRLYLHAVVYINPIQSCLKDLLPRVVLKLSQEPSNMLENLAEILERVSTLS